MCVCIHIYQFSTVAQSCLTPCDPMNRSTPGLPVHHQPPEFTQTHVRRVGDAVQPSHPRSSPSPPGPNLSQHQGFSTFLFLTSLPISQILQWLFTHQNIWDWAYSTCYKKQRFFLLTHAFKWQNLNEYFLFSSKRVWFKIWF